MAKQPIVSPATAPPHNVANHQPRLLPRPALRRAADAKKPKACACTCEAVDAARPKHYGRFKLCEMVSLLQANRHFDGTFSSTTITSPKDS